ncbi:hypothetical protein FA95DRAFT_1577360 [Auriscalpium vulgare]|uniref:Uncharacterized protein n=1 Tax=Auriscalpium vulgare TaxID=40419 RepID=A0ACB8R7B5_9AGAM|nr:hypothetical protein FA95DRAFT_1577360 [Auriscalpium vulgare]
MYSCPTSPAKHACSRSPPDSDGLPTRPLPELEGWPHDPCDIHSASLLLFLPVHRGLDNPLNCTMLLPGGLPDFRWITAQDIEPFMESFSYPAADRPDILTRAFNVTFDGAPCEHLISLYDSSTGATFSAYGTPSVPDIMTDENSIALALGSAIRAMGIVVMSKTRAAHGLPVERELSEDLSAADIAHIINALRN